jgi:hypothetical protein
MSNVSDSSDVLSLPCLSSATIKPYPKPGFIVSREVLEHLSPLHRLAAEAAIRDGRWRLVE